MSEISIKVNNLKKYFEEVKAVDGISFQVESGSIFGMLGPNGAGKTTTIETLVGLYQKDAGDISICGYSPTDELNKIKELIGVQLQSPSLFPRLTVKEVIKLFASFYSEPADVDKIIAKIRLEAKTDTRVKNLSGGQRHRLAVGLAMISNGNIIFLDEPTTGLDPQARRQLWNVIKDLKNEGKTVFLTTHYMDEAEKLCDKLVIIDKGKIIAKGSPEELIHKNFKETAVEFTDPGFTENQKDKLKTITVSKRVNLENEENHIILYSLDVPSTISKLMDFAAGKGKEIKDIVVRQASLEDVFLKLTGRGIRE
ncbi:MAG: ABC transporter ATP-binding protein [Halanaerobiales bacterium]